MMNMYKYLPRLICATALTVSAAAAVPAQAGSYPTKPVHIVVPYAAGGGADMLARAIGQKLGAMWKQPVIVENRVGAGAVIGTRHVAESAPDGYTLLMASPSYAISPALYKNSGFDPVKDFAPVVLVASGPLVLVVSASSPLNSMADLLKQARAKPGSINYGSSGIGSPLHLASELLDATAKIHTMHVPYGGTAPALTDLLGGQIQTMFAPVPTILGYVKAGKLKALGVTTVKPFPALPKVPPIADSVPGYEMLQWWGLVAPKGVPQSIIDQLNADVAKVLREPDMQQRLDAMGAVPGGGPAAQFGTLIRSEVDKWAKVIHDAGIQIK